MVDATDLDASLSSGPGRHKNCCRTWCARLLANTPGVTGVSVRTGSSIGMTGYDGQAHGGAGTSFVPAGPGVWELGTSGNPRKKAQDDYRNRTKNPMGIDPAATAFITVSLRKWDEPDRQDRLTRRNKEGIWRIVVALDADDLDGWLDETRAVRIWVSEQMGRRPRCRDPRSAGGALGRRHASCAAGRPAPCGAPSHRPRQLGKFLPEPPPHTGSWAPSGRGSSLRRGSVSSADHCAAGGDLGIPVLVVASADEWGRLVDGTVPTALSASPFHPTDQRCGRGRPGGSPCDHPDGPDEDPGRAAMSLPHRP